jgi:transposase-like protein
MPQYQLTVDSEQLQQLFHGNSQLAILVEQILNQILDAQVSEQLQAQPYERSDQRQGYRNGYRSRQLTTRVGTLTLRVPQVRAGEFSTDLFARYQRNEQALVLTLMEMVIQGVSTRKVAAITETLCGKEFSKSTVSALCQQLDPLVQAWNERSLAEQTYPFVVVDALVIRIREEERVVARSALIATGVTAEGHRELLGLQIGSSESEASWGAFFAALTQRGLQGVDLVVSDDHAGLVKAIRQHFQGAVWQRCQTHFARNLLRSTPADLQREVLAHLHAITRAPDLATARHLRDQFLSDYRSRAAAACAKLDEAFDDITAVLALPLLYRQRLRTTNGQERLNQEIRRRERVIRIFPNTASAVRLIGALLSEYHDQWATGKKYFDMTAYHLWKARPLQAVFPSMA